MGVRKSAIFTGLRELADRARRGGSGRKHGEEVMNARAKHHMMYLAAGAEMASRHARALPFRTPFPTAAVDELRDAEQALEEALQRVRSAMAEYDGKPTL
jgi:hypothetical protein